MGLLAALNHLVNFFSPAVVLALLLVLGTRCAVRSQPCAPGWLWQVGAQSLLGSVVLVGGTWLLERDGKMLTYSALVLVSASLQGWWLRRPAHIPAVDTNFP